MESGRLCMELQLDKIKLLQGGQLANGVWEAVHGAAPGQIEPLQGGQLANGVWKALHGAAV